MGGSNAPWRPWDDSDAQIVKNIPSSTDVDEDQFMTSQMWRSSLSCSSSLSLHTLERTPPTHSNVITSPKPLQQQQPTFPTTQTQKLQQRPSLKYNETFSTNTTKRQPVLNLGKYGDVLSESPRRISPMPRPISQSSPQLNVHEQQSGAASHYPSTAATIFYATDRNRHRPYPVQARLVENRVQTPSFGPVTEQTVSRSVGTTTTSISPHPVVQYHLTGTQAWRQASADGMNWDQRMLEDRSKAANAIVIKRQVNNSGLNNNQKISYTDSHGHNSHSVCLYSLLFFSFRCFCSFCSFLT